MPLKKLYKAVEAFRTSFSAAKEKGSESAWNKVVKNSKKISDIAKFEDWQSVLDACETGEELAQKLSTKDISDEPKAFKHFEKILKILDNLRDDIEANGQVTISIKGDLAKIKLFLGDFVSSPDESQDSQQSDDSDMSLDVMHELHGRVETLEHLVLEITGSHIEPETMNGIFREYHTLKGEAGFLGFESLGKFCHRVEATLEPLRDKKISVNQDIIDILLFFVDRTKLYILNIQNNVQTAEDHEADEKLSLLASYFRDMEQAEEAPAAGDAKSEADSGEFAEAFPLDGDDKEDEEQPAAELPSTEQAKKDGPDAEAVEEEPIEADLKSDLSDQPVFLNVETNKVDTLINITGELTILYQMLRQSDQVRQITDQKITNNIDMMGRFFKELQNIAISIRTVSIQPLFLKMGRLARNLAKNSKKNIKVSISGEAAQVDKNLINLLAGPLAHIIRNCIDHGIEPAHERIEANKNEAGHIQIKAKKRGNSTLIEISDDGKGICFDKLEQKAKELGLVEPKAVLTDAEKYELLFEPGLSTATKVTRTSGRGVGMDVIRSEIQKAKGTLDIKSEVGKGTTTSMLFAQTFAITDGLVVRVKRNFFVIPIEQVREMSQFDPDKVESVNKKTKMILLRNHYVPLIELENFLSVKSNGSDGKNFEKNNTSQIIVVVENEERRCVLLVDEVIASQEVVVKELTGSFADLPYFSGTAILGNKGVGLILDVAKITDLHHTFQVEKDAGWSGRKHDDDRINVVEIGTNTVAMIDFFIDTPGERFNFAINAFKTREFIPMDTYKTTPLPASPVGFGGVITLRGKTLPVFSLAKLLGIDSEDARPKDKIAIVCEFAQKTLGFLVTGVTKVKYISWGEILPPPKTSGQIALKNIIGIILKKQTGEQRETAKTSQDITFVLDFEKILNDVFPLYDSLENTIKLRKTRKTNNTILLVEDSAIMRSKMKEALEAGGITVVEAENGQVALDIVNDFFHQSKEADGSIFDYIDLIISDIEMPQLDGYTFTKTIKSHPELRVLPVLLHSSLSNETIVQRAKEVQADGFIAKCDPKNLVKALEKYL